VLLYFSRRFSRISFDRAADLSKAKNKIFSEQRLSAVAASKGEEKYIKA